MEPASKIIYKCRYNYIKTSIIFLSTMYPSTLSKTKVQPKTPGSHLQDKTFWSHLNASTHKGFFLYFFFQLGKAKQCADFGSTCTCLGTLHHCQWPCNYCFHFSALSSWVVISLVIRIICDKFPVYLARLNLWWHILGGFLPNLKNKLVHILCLDIQQYKCQQ